jgi:hypothetical protein
MDDELDLLNTARDDDDDDDDDPGPDPDDDPEGDCESFHQCQGSQWGYCVLRKGHGGKHFCTKCASYFD